MTKRSKILTVLIFGLLALGCFVSAARSLKFDRHVATVVACFGGVSFVIGALVSYLAWVRRQPSACPKCAHAERAHLSREEKEERDGFRVFALEKCAACGHIWEPYAPRWLLVFGAAVGISVVVFGVYMLTDELRPTRNQATVGVTRPIAGPTLLHHESSTMRDQAVKPAAWSVFRAICIVTITRRDGL